MEQQLPPVPHPVYSIAGETLLNVILYESAADINPSLHYLPFIKPPKHFHQHLSGGKGCKLCLSQVVPNIYELNGANSDVTAWLFAVGSVRDCVHVRETLKRHFNPSQPQSFKTLRCNSTVCSSNFSNQEREKIAAFTVAII